MGEIVGVSFFRGRVFWGEYFATGSRFLDNLIGGIFRGEGIRRRLRRASTSKKDKTRTNIFVYDFENAVLETRMREICPKFT